MKSLHLFLKKSAEKVQKGKKLVFLGALNLMFLNKLFIKVLPKKQPKIKSVCLVFGGSPSTSSTTFRQQGKRK